MHTACRIQFQAVVGLRCLFPTGLSSRGHSRKQPCSLVYGLLLSSRSVTADGDLFTSSLCDLPRAPSLLPFLRLYLSDPSRRKFCVCKAHVEEGWQVGKPEVPKQQEGINCKWQTFFFPTRHKIKRLLFSLSIHLDVVNFVIDSIVLRKNPRICIFYKYPRWFLGRL